MHVMTGGGEFCSIIGADGTGSDDRDTQFI
jgi:hypothetical protein